MEPGCYEDQLLSDITFAPGWKLEKTRVELRDGVHGPVIGYVENMHFDEHGHLRGDIIVWRKRTESTDASSL